MGLRALSRGSDALSLRSAGCVSGYGDAPMTRKVVIPVLAVALALAAVAAVAARLDVDRSFHSRATAGSLSYRVWLPDAYDPNGDRRYPVIYFLHGLPAGPNGYRGAGFVAAALRRANRDAIVVAPQGARATQPDAEYLDRGPGRRWETAIASELVGEVDSSYRTFADRRGRAIVGVSAGGYGAMLVGLHHLDEFAAIESWSGYFHPTDSTGWRALDLGSPAANRRASAHTYVPVLRDRLRRDPTFLGFYVGSGDDRFADENEQLDRELRRARVPHLFREYPGGHGQALWSAHAPVWLNLAVAHLAPAG